MYSFIKFIVNNGFLEKKVIVTFKQAGILIPQFPFSNIKSKRKLFDFTAFLSLIIVYYHP